MIIVTVIWAVIYAVSLQFVTVGTSQVNFSEAGSLFFSHMWYMPMIIGMYLSMPFVSSALSHFDPKTINQATIVFALLAFLLPFITLVLDMHGIKNETVQYCLGFSRGVYGIYIVLGYLVKKDMFKQYSSKKMALLQSCHS